VTGKAYSIRYTFPALVAFMGVLAVILRRPRGALAWTTIALLLAIFVVADAQHFLLTDYRKDDSRAVVRWLADRLPAGAVVEVAPGYVSGVLDYYARQQDTDVRFIPSDAQDLPGRPAALLLTRLHHVTDPTAEVEHFRRSAGFVVKQDTVGGYLVWSAPTAVRATSRGPDPRGPDARPVPSLAGRLACRPSVPEAGAWPGAMASQVSEAFTSTVTPGNRSS
jgi:hypothetical protein